MARKVLNEEVTVIIPAFNASATLFKCLEALEKQTFKPGEVIIIDDGSTDKTLEVLSELKTQNSKLKILKQKHKGVSEARNLGAKKAQGQILAFIDSDCVPEKNWLKNIVAALSNLTVGAVGAGYSGGADNSFWQRFCYEELSFRRRKMNKFVTTALSNNMACRKNLFWEAGGFPKKYPVCEDMFLTYQISRKYKISWLKGNGVKHHFKKSLKSFLKHQYFFGRESTRFFLDNPQILVESNHQGKQLYLAIGTSLMSLFAVFIAITFFITGNIPWVKLAFVLGGIFLILHLFLYTGFIFYLQKKELSKINLIRAYLVSYLRDLVAAFSSFAGLVLYIKMRKL